jgi:ABC-type uncharacterized transport system permease subunit
MEPIRWTFWNVLVFLTVVLMGTVMLYALFKIVPPLIAGINGTVLV